MLLTVDEILQSIARLKPMPSSVTQILREIEKHEVTIDNLVGMIGLDQVLTAQVLQISNSATLGYARTCSTLHEAIMHIGLQRLKSILMTSTATSMMGRSLRGYRLGAGELWQHSLVVGSVAEARTLLPWVIVPTVMSNKQKLVTRTRNVLPFNMLHPPSTTLRFFHWRGGSGSLRTPW